MWSHGNTHGDLVLTTNNTGAQVGTVGSYDPFGNPLGTTSIDNADGDLDYGWHGQAQRPLEHLTGLQPTIEMGARPYQTSLGRFLATDPIEGGGANDFGYPNDPMNMHDLDGRCWGFAKDLPGCGTVRRVTRRAAKAVGTAPRATFDAVKWVARRIDVSASVCLGRCFGVGQQGGNFYLQSGWGIGAGVQTGLASKEYKNRPCSGTQVLSLGPVYGTWSHQARDKEFGVGAGTPAGYMFVTGMYDDRRICNSPEINTR
ncbi:MAG: hypothetical protein E6Q57_08705 [Mycobacterium sp.]|nr:MAG: hypothetical protein E6Q57_08705 [Mycobacterium sp.]